MYDKNDRPQQPKELVAESLILESSLHQEFSQRTVDIRLVLQSLDQLQEVNGDFIISGKYIILYIHVIII